MLKFFKSFGYASEGILHAFKSELNFKVHILATIIVIFAGLMTGLSMSEWLVIILLFGGMLALEMVNSAIERTVDAITVNRDPLAKQAKDLAAGAVLIFAITSAIIGLFIFIPKWLL